MRGGRRAGRGARTRLPGTGVGAGRRSGSPVAGSVAAHLYWLLSLWLAAATNRPVESVCVLQVSGVVMMDGVSNALAQLWVATSGEMRCSGGNLLLKYAAQSTRAATSVCIKVNAQS